MLRKLEMELAVQCGQSPSVQLTSPLGSRQPTFDVRRNSRLVPPFSEREDDQCLAHFERVATTLKWPKDM